LGEEHWIAWQFHRPDQDDGVVQAFRRSRSEDASMRFKLHVLDANIPYEVEDFDNEGTLKLSGRQLMDEGLLVKLSKRRQAATIIFKRVSSLSAIIMAMPQEGEMPLTVTYDGTDSYDPNGTIMKYAWQFADGSTASGSAAKHTYEKDGTYTAKLTVTNSKGVTDTSAATIVVTPVDTAPLKIVSVTANGHADRVVVTFSEPVEQISSETLSNYTVDNGIKINSVSLGADLMTVNLKTSELSENIAYTLSVYNVKDRAAKPNPIAPNSRKTFRHTSLIAHWKLDDGEGLTAGDSSGNGHHGTLENGPTWTKSRIGGSLSFDGVDDYITTDTYFPGLTLPSSISLWVNPAPSQLQYADILGNHGEPYVGMAMQQDGNNINSFGFGYGDGKEWQGSGSVQLKANEWQHVVVVCDGTNAIFYVNGDQKSRRPAKNPVAPNPAQDFKLGQGYHTGRYFHGLLSDVRIYKRALAVAEITELAKDAER